MLAALGRRTAHAATALPLLAAQQARHISTSSPAAAGLRDFLDCIDQANATNGVYKTLCSHVIRLHVGVISNMAAAALLKWLLLACAAVQTSSLIYTVDYNSSE